MVEISVFISSKMQELAPERQILFEFLPTLNTDMVQIKPWIFENDAPASDNSIREVYLEALKNSALYIGLFWNEYGEWTIDEFERASERNIPRHIYLKDVEANDRKLDLTEFLNKHSSVEYGITAKWFKTLEDLKEAVEQSINTWVHQHIIQRPGDLRARLFRSSNDIYELPEHFVGREDERRQLQVMLKNKNARVLIQGFGGEGKRKCDTNNCSYSGGDIQRHISGDEYRVITVGDTVVQASLKHKTEQFGIPVFDYEWIGVEGVRKNGIIPHIKEVVKRIPGGEQSVLGFDIIHDGSRPWTIEINTSPGVNEYTARRIVNALE